MFVQNALPLAFAQATKSPMVHKHGAVLLDRAKVKMDNDGSIVAVSGVVIAVGYNTWLRRRRRSRHAEDCVLAKVPRGMNPADLTLIVVRKNEGNSKPCPTCENRILRREIGTVIFS